MAMLCTSDLMYKDTVIQVSFFVAYGTIIDNKEAFYDKKNGTYM